MKPLTLIGIVFVVLGVIGFALGGFHFTQEKQDAKIGPLEIDHKETHTVPIPPVISGLAVGLGIVLVVAGASGNKS